MAKCKWTPDEDGIYDTGCGNRYELMHGTPKENDMNYCLYCGKKLDEETELHREL